MVLDTLYNFAIDYENRDTIAEVLVDVYFVTLTYSFNHKDYNLAGKMVEDVLHDAGYISDKDMPKARQNSIDMISLLLGKELDIITEYDIDTRIRFYYYLRNDKFVDSYIGAFKKLALECMSMNIYTSTYITSYISGDYANIREGLNTDIKRDGRVAVSAIARYVYGKQFKRSVKCKYITRGYDIVKVNKNLYRVDHIPNISVQYEWCKTLGILGRVSGSIMSVYFPDLMIGYDVNKGALCSQVKKGKTLSIADVTSDSSIKKQFLME